EQHGANRGSPAVSAGGSQTHAESALPLTVATSVAHATQTPRGTVRAKNHAYSIRYRPGVPARARLWAAPLPSHRRPTAIYGSRARAGCFDSTELRFERVELPRDPELSPLS